MGDIVELPQPLGLFARENWERADQYLDAFERLAKTDEPQPKHAMYFLLTHAIELFLKAYLAACGVPKRDLKDQSIRHNLPKLHTLCEEHNLTTVDYLREYVSHFQEMNDQHDFRYPTNFNLTVPSPPQSIEVLHRLRTATESKIARASNDAWLKFAEETRHLKGKKIRWSD